MVTVGADPLDSTSLLAVLGPQLTADQATLIFDQGKDAVVFALLNLAKQLAERQATPSTAGDPSAPSGQTPPYSKPTAKGRAKPKGAKPGHPGRRRPTPTCIDRHEEHTLAACPKCHGPVTPCRGSRARVIEDIPADITPVVTEHTIHRSWCPHCRVTVEPTVPDALPGSSIGLRVVVLSAWLHYLLGTTLAQIIDVFNFHLQFKLSAGGLILMWRRLREILLAWHLEIQAQALASAVLHADEDRLAGRRQDLLVVVLRVEGRHLLHDRPESGQPGIEAVLQGRVRRGVGDRLLGRLQRGPLHPEAEMSATPAARPEADAALPQARRRLAGVLQTIEAIDPRFDPTEQAAEGTFRWGVRITTAPAG